MPLHFRLVYLESLRLTLSIGNFLEVEFRNWSHQYQMNFYFQAAKVLDKLDAKQGSIKSIIATVNEKDRKRTAALVIETLKYKPILNEILDATKLLKEERKITSRSLALVLTHDLLLASGIQAGDGPIKQAILRHKTRLHSEFTRIKIKRGVKSNSELALGDDARAARIPRYVRINTSCWTTEEAIPTFVARGFELADPFASESSFARDEHIPDLLAFNPRTQFVDDLLYKEGKIILQDKASCFPAFVLSPDDKSMVIDATAAPGNKTSHLSALMGNKGKLFAFERDRKRFSTLKTMLSKAHCRNVEAVNVDFLTTSPTDERFSQVTHILLDPSCSGSGIVNRLDHLLETEDENDAEQDRLNKLATFQLLMIRHAMKFPSIQRIVYSTCSVHAIENEHVVRKALATDECSKGGFQLADPAMVLPGWKRRGLADEMGNAAEAQSLVRCSPDEDATNGFFVCLFVRVEPEDENKLSEIGSRKRGAADSEVEASDAGERKRRKMRKKAKANPDRR
ncbi:S-adenosyl-L-methionine-dependent methyltransferase [Laetiporus sulphureus 93-53]|uniref:S-adenosyl-L-methionine-dependent methyltransferase n=1 Tax=Laetiporus sulphureus 93-53 TaxID=1314785 RepID=A0A165ETE4_9APHY|nr:S-adenosyl-L-methionine-dependent methyltransferase [Laetiporus sulphureus 93-53]KZT07718.1 S-adenosyl-L-methionine-dependent methyltransferase [Laetiporus sulphureus 93-53]